MGMGLVFELCFFVLFLFLMCLSAGSIFVKDLQARCVLLSDSSQACNGTIISPSSAALLSSSTDVSDECQTGGSIRWALIAILGFIVIPIPFLLRYVDGEAGHTEAASFASKHTKFSLASSVRVSSTVSGSSVSIGNISNDCDAASRPTYELSIRPSDRAATTAIAPVAALLQTQSQ